MRSEIRYAVPDTTASSTRAALGLRSRDALDLGAGDPQVPRTETYQQLVCDPSTDEQ